MNARERRPIGRSGVAVSPLGLGAAPLGDLFVRLSDDEARAIVRAALDAGVTLVDTAPYYGLGLSEHRVGDALRELPGDSRVLATKVGRVLHPVPRGARRADASWAGGLAFDAVFHYGYDAVHRSHEDSLQRLGLPAVDLLAIHDLDLRALGPGAFERHLHELERGGARALEELRGGGAVRGIGLGITALGSIRRVLELIDLDYALVAMQYTLLDQPALDEELPLCLERGVGVVVGAPFASGVLADGEGGTYDYGDVPSPVRERVRRLRAVCERHGVPLRAAALQFPLGHSAVAAVIPGAVSAAQVRANAEAFALEIPDALWDELKSEGLLRADAPAPHLDQPRDTGQTRA